MPQYLYANSNVIHLGADLAPSATTLTLAAGTGSLWPALGGGQVFNITLIDSATGATTEIVQATAHAAGSTTLTIVRAQEGTTAKQFHTGDIAVLMMTAAVFNNFAQLTNPSAQTFNSQVNSVIGASLSDGNQNAAYLLYDTTFRLAGVFLHTATQNYIQLRSDIPGVSAGTPATLDQTCKLTVVSLVQTSDERTKYMIRPVESALDKVCQLDGVLFNQRASSMDWIEGAGVIAQTVLNVFPVAVHQGNGDRIAVDGSILKDSLSVNYNALSALYVESFKEVRNQLLEMKEEITLLKSEIKQLKGE